MLFIFLFLFYGALFSDSIVFSVCDKIISEKDIKNIFPLSCILKKIPVKKCNFNDEEMQKFAIGMYIISQQKKCYFDEMKVNFDELKISEEELLKNYNINKKDLISYKISQKTLNLILKPEILFNIYVSNYFTQHYSHLTLAPEEKEEQMKTIAESLLEKIKARYLIEQKY